VARKLGVHRRQVRQAFADAQPPARKQPERCRPVLAGLMPFIEAILTSDRQAPRKQRHTQAQGHALERHGIARMRPGKIPAWWWGLTIKPDPRVLFEVEDWPDDEPRGAMWHLQRQELIHGRYKWRPWYPAFARGISWYELCRQRESMAGIEQPNPPGRK
jgi:hypothetical protein